MARNVRFALLRWSNVDKCLLVAAILWGAGAVFALSASLAGGWPYLPEGVPRPVLRELAISCVWLMAGWTALLGLGVALRRRKPDSRVLVYAVVQYYSIVTALFSYVVGPFAAAGWIALLGGAFVGFLLFERAAVWFGVSTWVITLVTVSYLGELGVMPLGPVDGTLWRNGVIAVALSALILPLCSAIVTSWRDYEQQLERLSKTDDLTGVANRRHFMELFAHELRQARRYGRDLSCVMVDLDHFKRVNDDHGHVVGDQVLQAAADAIRRSVRDTDLVGRYGGEEFVLLLPNTDLAGAREVAERCRRLIAETRVNTLAVTASLGIAAYPSASVDSVDDLIHEADEALYRAKHAGRDRVDVAAY